MNTISMRKAKKKLKKHSERDLKKPSEKGRGKNVEKSWKMGYGEHREDLVGGPGPPERR